MATRRIARRRSVRKTVARAGRSTATTSLRYVESSALAAALLEHDAAVLRAPAGAQHVTSALTFAEVGRAIMRARAIGRVTPAEERAAVRALRTFERRCFIVDVDRAVLARVRRRFPLEPLRTLDAVHLATAELLGEPPPVVTIVTRDARVHDNARALGYMVE